MKSKLKIEVPKQFKGKHPPPNNKRATKTKDSFVMAQAFGEFCSWIERGYPKTAFTFQFADQKFSYKTLMKHFKDNPSEFPLSHLEYAECKNYAYWFEKVKQSAEGKLPKANTTSMQAIMKNLHKWDKKMDDEQKNEVLDEILGKLRERI